VSGGPAGDQNGRRDAVSADAGDDRNGSMQLTAGLFTADLQRMRPGFEARLPHRGVLRPVAFEGWWRRRAAPNLEAGFVAGPCGGVLGW
jgi:hypothetical protein